MILFGLGLLLVSICFYVGGRELKQPKKLYEIPWYTTSVFILILGVCILVGGIT